MKKLILLAVSVFSLITVSVAQDVQQALGEAIESKSLDNVKKVVEEFHADVNKKINNKRYGDPIPLNFACLLGDVEISRYLLDKGAKIDNEDKMGQTALICLCYSALNSDEAQASRLEIFKMLLAKGIDLNAVSKGGTAAIANAAYYKQTLLVKALIDAGAEVDQRKNDFAKTALMLAAEQGWMDIVKMLHEAGADPKESVRVSTAAGTFNEFTAADLAKNKNHMDVNAYLKSAKKIKKK